MDEPDSDRQDEGEHRVRLPSLILIWTAVYLLVGLGMTMFWDAGWTRAYPDGALKVHAVALGTLTLLFLYAFVTAGRAPKGAVEPEAWLCQHCLKPYVPGAHFCPRCGAPKSFYSGTCPYERAHAQAWILGKVAWHPSRPLHVVGLWLIGGSVLIPAAALLLNGLLWLLGLSDAWSDPSVLVGLLVMDSLWIVVSLIGLRSWGRRRRGLEPVPPEIGYGCPPWFSYDTEWALPEFEEDPGDDDGAAGATPEAG